MKTKLMQITHDLAIGGLQQVVVNICRTIDKSEFDVSVLCLRDLGEFVPEIEKLGIKIHFLPQKENGTDYLSFLKVAKILRQEKIQVIHTHNTQPFVDGTIGALLSGVKTIIHTDHARDFPDKFRYMAAEHLMSYLSYRVVGVSEHTSANLIKHEKISPKKITTIENGIDGSRFAINIDQKKKRKELGIRNNEPIIGLGVRLAEQKGIIYLLQAMPEVVASYPDITLLIVGDGDIRTELENEAKQLGIAANVIFLGARLDIPQLLKLFDIYVLPSVWEGMPMVLLEAMAAECPIIATNVGGIPKVIKHEHNGLLVDSKSPKRLTSAIIRLLSNKQQRDQYANNGLTMFHEKFSAQNMTSQYEKLYLRS